MPPEDICEPDLRQALGASPRGEAWGVSQSIFSSDPWPKDQHAQLSASCFGVPPVWWLSRETPRKATILAYPTHTIPKLRGIMNALYAHWTVARGITTVAHRNVEGPNKTPSILKGLVWTKSHSSVFQAFALKKTASTHCDSW